MIALSQNIKQRVIGRFPSGVWLMMGLDLLLNIGWSAASPFLALYLHNERAIPMSLVGTIFLVGGVCSGSTNLIGGMLSDRLGRRRLLLAVLSAGVLASVALAFLIGSFAPVWLIAFVFVASRGINSTINPTISAIVADLSPRDRLAESYAMVRVGGNVGFAMGPAISGFLVGYLSYGWLFGISAFTGLIVVLLIYFFLHGAFAGNNETVNFRSTLAVSQDRQFLVFAVVSILLVLSIGHLGSTMSVFTVDRLGFSTAQYGLLLTTNGLFVVLFQYPVTYLVRKITKANGLVLGSLFYVVGYASLGWITSFNWAILTIVLITAGEVTLSPISSSVVAESAPAEKRGRYMGFFALSQTVGYSLSPLFGGLLLDHFPTDGRTLWGIIASVGVVAAIGFYGWGKMTSKKQSSMP